MYASNCNQSCNQIDPIYRPTGFNNSEPNPFNVTVYANVIAGLTEVKADLGDLTRRLANIETIVEFDTCAIYINTISSCANQAIYVPLTLQSNQIIIDSDVLTVTSNSYFNNINTSTIYASTINSSTINFSSQFGDYIKVSTLCVSTLTCLSNIIGIE